MKYQEHQTCEHDNCEMAIFEDLIGNVLEIEK
jgi:hypothetical protein